MRNTITLNLNVKKFLPELLWVLKARSTNKLTWAPRNYSEDRHILLPDFLRGPIFELMMFIEYKITKGGLLKTYRDELYSKFTMGSFVIEEGPDYKVVYIKQALKKAGAL